MNVFSPTLTQMLVLFVFIAIGYFFNFKRLIPSDSYKMISKLEATLLLPCLIFNTFRNYCTIENFKLKSSYLLVGTIVMAVSVVISEILSRVLTDNKYLKKIYAYSLAIPNFGFMGNAVVLGVFGEEVLFDFMMFTIPANLFAYSYGTASLIPNKKVFSPKTLLNPVFISLVLGALCGITQIPVPKFIINATTSAGNCMAPLAMFLTGVVIANYNLLTLAKDIKVYIITFLRLIAIPAIMVLIIKLCGVESGIVRSALCFLAMPLGLNTVVFPAAYGGDTTPGAAMALVSHLLSVITIPVIFAILL